MTDRKNLRPFRKEECELIKFILEGRENDCGIVQKLPNYQVFDMDDGHMGSVRVMSSTQLKERKFGRIIAESKFLDSDGVLVSVAIVIDANNKLYELDMWKVNFEPLVDYPSVTRCKKSNMPKGVEKPLPAGLGRG